MPSLLLFIIHNNNVYFVFSLYPWHARSFSIAAGCVAVFLHFFCWLPCEAKSQPSENEIVFGAFFEDSLTKTRSRTTTVDAASIYCIIIHFELIIFSLSLSLALVRSLGRLTAMTNSRATATITTKHHKIDEKTFFFIQLYSDIKVILFSFGFIFVIFLYTDLVFARLLLSPSLTDFVG